MQAQTGFTLIELLVAIAIVSVLAMVGLPAYTDYQIRARLVDDLELAKTIQLQVTEYYQIRGKLPENNEDLGLPKDKEITGSRLEKLKIDDKPMPGTIKLYFDSKVAFPMMGKENELYLVPSVHNGRLIWDCKGGDVADRFRPASCRGQSPYDKNQKKKKKK